MTCTYQCVFKQLSVFQRCKYKPNPLVDKSDAGVVRLTTDLKLHSKRVRMDTHAQTHKQIHTSKSFSKIIKYSRSHSWSVALSHHDSKTLHVVLKLTVIHLFRMFALYTMPINIPHSSYCRAYKHTRNWLGGTITTIANSQSDESEIMLWNKRHGIVLAKEVGIDYHPEWRNNLPTIGLVSEMHYRL